MDINKIFEIGEEWLVKKRKTEFSGTKIKFPDGTTLIDGVEKTFESSIKVSKAIVAAGASLALAAGSYVHKDKIKDVVKNMRNRF